MKRRPVDVVVEVVAGLRSKVLNLRSSLAGYKGDTHLVALSY